MKTVMRRTTVAVLLAGLALWAPRLAAAPPALDGNCPVCLLEAGKVIPGKKEYQLTFDRQTYGFPGEKERDLFRANPAKYAPVLAGDCAVCLVEMGARMPGKAEFATTHGGRLYLFPSQKQRELFRANPNKYADADVGLGRYCPVCLLDARKWVPGKAEFASVYDGFRYFFPGAEAKQKFDANPAKYVPALSGNCVVCLKDGGKHVRGTINHGARQADRIYLFPDEGARAKFLAKPAVYADLDLAAKGNCVVCQKLMGKAMPGSREHASVYKGKLYLFPGAKQREMFDADPTSFLTPAAPRPEGAAAPAAAPGRVTVVGKTACAGCEYGVRPLTDPQSLGLAVVTAERVYIVERAEALYPQLYSDRFAGGRVELTGTVRRTEGRFSWIDPVSLKAVP
ncbi:MAG: hypothetical protein L0Z62_27205 [Gemmataceae bacterium]|nr:hypothetical protein [Gemmataceae bacterium]